MCMHMKEWGGTITAIQPFCLMKAGIQRRGYVPHINMCSVATPPFCNEWHSNVALYRAGSVGEGTLKVTYHRSAYRCGKQGLAEE